MARFRKHRRIGRSYYFSKGRRHSSGGLGKGTMGNMIDGAIIGAAQSIIPDDLLWGMADPLIMAGWGWFRKNPTAQFLGGYQLGSKAVQLFTGGAVGGTQGGLY